eukprot:GHVS01019135.1.p1 GENE.GHVS01019135.1~~GHVS01019135.1.p1  ORF type:complete len:416 (+),score=74.00 GHVS01019135.1:243-1490(+)
MQKSMQKSMCATAGLELLQGVPSERTWKNSRGGERWNRCKQKSQGNGRSLPQGGPVGRRRLAVPMEEEEGTITPDTVCSSMDGGGGGGGGRSVWWCGCSSGEEGCATAYRAVIGDESVRQFVVDFIRHFRGRVETLRRERCDRQQAISAGTYPLEFHPQPTNPPSVEEEEELPSATLTATATNEPSSDWRISPLPLALRNRMVDIGDCNPADAHRLYEALHTPNVSAVQVDMDDGFCPNWPNIICGLYHVMLAARGQLHAHINKTSTLRTPIAYMMFRPRAWNMVEPNVLVDGVRVFGALFDFAIFMYHNARLLYANGTGPYLYLSKVEAESEARLWDDVFTWTEHRLQLPHGCTKGCVLIESLPAVFQMPNILFALRSHSAGLNCGLWDYAASFISRLGDRALFPDRSKLAQLH